MAGENLVNLNRSDNFKEIPNTYAQFINRTKVLDRKVLFEKTKKNIKVSRLDEYFNSLIRFSEVTDELRNTIRAAVEAPRVLVEKNIYLVHTRKELKQTKKDRYELLEKLVTNIKSKCDDNIIDITSLENVDFDSPCSQEQLKELKKTFDYYVFQESIDEIDGIKNIEMDGIDVSRLNYFRTNKLSSDITKNFTEHQTVRLSDDYFEQVNKKTDSFFQSSLRRRVIIEKTDLKYANYPTMARYEHIFKELPTMEERQAYRNSDSFLQERNEVMADFYRLIIDERG